MGTFAFEDDEDVGVPPQPDLDFTLSRFPGLLDFCLHRGGSSQLWGLATASPQPYARMLGWPSLWYSMSGEEWKKFKKVILESLEKCGYE